MGKSSPPNPDFHSAAMEGQQASQQAIGQQTQANRPNQYSGFGATTWDASGQHQSFSPEMQGLFNTAVGGGDPTQARQQAQDSLYNRGAQYLDPQFQQREQQTRAGLVNGGNMPGDPGYNNEMTLFNDSRQKAYGDLRDSAIAGGGVEAQRQQQLALNPFLAMSAASGQFQMPQFQRAGAFTPGDFLGAATNQYGANLNGYNAGQMQTQGTLNGIGALASLPFAFA